MMYDNLNYFTDFEFQIAISDGANLNTTDVDLENNFIVYPNPVKNSINIKTNESINKIEVFDLTGRLIFSSKSINENKVDLSDLKTGNYLLKIYTKNGTKNTKIIKE